jgi:outer membrane protease
MESNRYLIRFQIIRAYEATIEADSEAEAYNWVRNRNTNELENDASHKDTFVDYIEVETICRGTSED